VGSHQLTEDTHVPPGTFCAHWPGMDTTTQPTVIRATPLSVPPRRADTLFGHTPSVASELQPCDRCPSAGAKVKATYATGPVYLCGHHARESWDVLERTALRIRGDLPSGSFYLPMGPVGACLDRPRPR